MAYQNADTRRQDKDDKSVASAVSDKASEFAGKAGHTMERAMETAETAVHDIAERGRDAGERVQTVAGNMKAAIDKSVRSEPMATLAVAAVMGFVLGALWKS